MRRVLSAALVLGSLVFTVGGVAVTGRAGSSAQQSQESSGICQEPVRSNFAITAESFPADAGDTIVLNTRGYNYADPGMIQMDPIRRPTAAPSDQPPASPAKP
jgi:hypothetical protein